MGSFKKIWSILLPRQKRAAFVLFLTMLVATVLETLGVGLIIPVLALISKGTEAFNDPRFSQVLIMLGSPTESQLITMVMLALVTIYAFKALFLAFVAWRQSAFSANIQTSLSQRLFNGFVRQPYSFHLQRNSAQLIQSVINQSNQFSREAVLSALMFTAELLVMLGIACLLFSIEPLGAALVLTVIGVAGYFFHWLTKSRSLKWGKARQFHEGMKIMHLQQGLGAAKDVKLLGRERTFLESFSTHNKVSAKIWERQITVQALPRLWLELLAVSGLAILVLVMLWQGKAANSLLTTLGLFAAAAFRLMPSVNRILTSAQNFRFSEPVVNKMYAEITEIDKNNSITDAVGELSFDSTLKLEHVGFQYESAQQKTLQDISLSITKGESIGFVGGSGAGKTTLIDIVLGLLEPTEGKVMIDGQDIHAGIRSWMNKIGYVPQTIYLTDDTLRQNIAFGIATDKIDDTAVQKAIRWAQLEDFVAQLPEGLATKVGERGVRLSGGQRQRIGIARALYHDPEVLVLDEATSALDTKTEKEIMKSVNALHGDKTILIVAHRLSTVEDCDRIYRLDHGVIVDQGAAYDVLKLNLEKSEK